MQHLAEENIKYSVWYVRYKETIRKILIFILFFIDLVIVSGLALRFVVFSRASLNAINVENSLVADYIPFKQIKERLRPRDLIVRRVSSVRRESGEIDLLAEIYNPNSDWLAESFDYTFRVDGQPQAVMESFALPGRESWLMNFAVKTASPLPTVRFDLEQVKWTRAKDSERLAVLNQLAVGPPSFQNTSAGFTVRSQLTNNSAYGFWSVGITAVVTGTSGISGINFIVLDRISSGSVRDFSLTWPQSLSSARNVTLTPVVNVFNDSVYMPITSFGETGDPSGVELR